MVHIETIEVSSRYFPHFMLCIFDGAVNSYRNDDSGHSRRRNISLKFITNCVHDALFIRVVWAFHKSSSGTH